MPCDHDATDLEVAILGDGLCPLCLAADNATLRAELDEAKVRIGRMAVAQINRTERSNVMWTREHDRSEKAEAVLAAIQKICSEYPLLMHGTTTELAMMVEDTMRALRAAKGED